MRLAALRFAFTCAIALAAIALAPARDARADEPPAGAQPAQPPTSSAPGAPIDLEKDKDTQSSALADTPSAPPEAPPPQPYTKSVVLDSELGALVFLGQFGKTAPAGPMMRTQLGYELFKWLMVFGEGELAFTDTSGTQEPPKTRAFPMYGFGGGARLTVRFTDRIGAYLQGDLGLMKADIRKRALEIIGFANAESLGLEWYQIDRHFALGITSGLRDATGFKRTTGPDTPLALDAGGSLRYAF